MQLAVVLIREVWLCELRTYGFSKDIEWFRVEEPGRGGCRMPQSVKRRRQRWEMNEWVNAYSMESDSFCSGYLLCGYFVI